MAQRLNFEMSRRVMGNTSFVKIEPGDATSYKFIIGDMPSGWHGDWSPERGPFIMVASIDGPVFPGMGFPLSVAREWWEATKEWDASASINHQIIAWIQGENFRTKVNPWTIRAALLAVVKEYSL